MNTFDQELYYWTHMLDEAFADIPQQQKIDMSKQFAELLRQFRINLNKDVANIIKTWFITDSEAMNLDQLKEKYTQNFIQEIRDRLLNYFEYKKSLLDNSININNQLFILSGDKSIKTTENRNIEYLDNINDSILNIIQQQNGEDYSISNTDQSQKFEQKYQFNANDKKEIKLLGCTEHIACWRTVGFETTNKFIYYIWRNPEMNGGYGKYMRNSPFCTREKEHWDTYSHENPNYEQFWFFKLPEVAQRPSGNLNNEQVFDILNKMSGHGGELLVGLDDTYLDDDNIEDHNTRTSKTDILSFSFHDHQKTDYSNEIKHFYNNILFTSTQFLFPNKYLIISSTKMNDYDIPDELVDMCFQIQDQTIKNAIIPDYITNIDAGAFRYCDELTSIHLPNSIKEIDDETFHGCQSLTSIDLPNSIEKIGNFSFRVCDSLTSIMIPNSVTSIGEDAFSECTSLISVQLPNSIREIQTNTFRNCLQLKFINIPNSIEKICNNAFTDCSSLTSIVIPNSVKYIGNGAFSGCVNIKKYSMPSSNIELGYRAIDFKNIETHIKIKDGTAEICERCFYDDKIIKSVELPQSITSIKANAFADCKSLTSINIPESVKRIGDSAFQNCSFTSINIPNSVEKIGEYAFSGCDKLRHINIPKSLHEINEGLFNCCVCLKTITIPDSVNAIYDMAFCWCDSLENVYIESNNIKYIGGLVFGSCDNLKNIFVKNENIKKLIIDNNSGDFLSYIVKVQSMNESKYSKQQLLEAIDYWTNVLNEYN